jgi:hypothetical protein
MVVRIVKFISCGVFALLAVFSMLVSFQEMAVSAQVELIATPTPLTPPFLVPPYYGHKDEKCFFDHHYPNYTENGDLLRYDTVELTNNVDITHCVSYESCYDGHDGYDFETGYEPVLAAGSGTVVHAAWTDNHDEDYGLGLYVILEHHVNYKLDCCTLTI